MHRILVFLILFPFTGYAQHLLKMHPGIPADTSFNISSEFRKQVKYFAQISVAQADTAGIRVFHDLVYCRYGKREMHLDVFCTEYSGNEKRPVVILIHGGGWRAGDKSMEWPLASALARKGFVTICPEYRLSMEALYPAAVIDIKTAIRWIRRHSSRFGADGSRIALSGTSAGGQLAALTGTLNDAGNLFPVNKLKRTDGRVQAVINIDGVLAFIHPESGEGTDKPGKPSAGTAWFGGNSTEKRDLWMQASALSHVHAGSAPVLFLNSAQPRFHAGRDDYSRKLDSLGIYSEVHTIPETPHTFWLFHPWFEGVVNVMADFLGKTFGKLPE